jgi:hypothetical protein
MTPSHSHSQLNVAAIAKAMIADIAPKENSLPPAASLTLPPKKSSVPAV